MNVRNVNNSKNKTIQLDYSLKTQISAEKKEKSKITNKKREAIESIRSIAYFRF